MTDPEFLFLILNSGYCIYIIHIIQLSFYLHTSHASSIKWSKAKLKNINFLCEKYLPQYEGYTEFLNNDNSCPHFSQHFNHVRPLKSVEIYMPIRICSVSYHILCHLSRRWIEKISHLRIGMTFSSQVHYLQKDTNQKHT